MKVPLLIRYIIVLILVSLAVIGLTSNTYAINTEIPSVFLLDNYTTNSDKTKAQQWFLDHDPKKDPRMQGTNVIKNVVVQGNNTMAKIKPSGSDAQVRINLYAGNASDFKGFQANAHTIPNQNTMSQNGYMFKPNDWRNVEITEYVKVNKLGSGNSNGGKHIELQARGGLHSDSIACEGTSYHFNIYQENGRVKMEKELKHSNSYYPNSRDDPVKLGVTNGLLNQGWIGIKMVVRDTPNGVNVEGYLNRDSPEDTDKPTNNWVLVLNKTDTGNNWHTKNNKSACPDSNSSQYSGRIIDWGGPLVIFRSDNLNDVDWKWASVREIVP